MTKTRAQSSTLPDGEAERGPAPIFTPILPPRITRTSHAALVKWRKERREYEDTIRNRAKGDTDDLIVPIKNTFDEGLLREWCRLRWKISIDDVTDSIILEEIEKIISSVKNNSVPDIDLEMAENLRMDLSESDQLCSILIKSLEPKALREEVDRTARFQVRKAREDEVVLHDLILEKALDHEKSFQNQRRAKRDRDRGDLPPTPCPHCGDVHWLSECPTATDSEKAEIRKKLRSQRGEKSKRELMLRDPTVKLTRLTTPVIICPVGEYVITCRASVNLRVLLNTAAGTVAIHEPVECLVISDGEPE
eukprot:jgi/Phyca11/109335/e_gw1.16.425.1